MIGFIQISVNPMLPATQKFPVNKYEIKQVCKEPNAL